MEKDERRKQAAEVSPLPLEKRPRTKDEEDWDMTLNRYETLNTVALPGL
jgi:hypothetical protein